MEINIVCFLFKNDWCFLFLKERINELFKIYYWFLNSKKLKLKFLVVQKHKQHWQTLYGDAQNIYTLKLKVVLTTLLILMRLTFIQLYFSLHLTCPSIIIISRVSKV